MICMICKKKINNTITWSNLFCEKTYYVCDSCFKKYPIKPNYQLIPLEEKVIHWFSLFDRKYSFPSIAYLNEISKLFSYVMNQKGIILYFDLVDDQIMKDIIELEVFREDIYLVTCFIGK